MRENRRVLRISLEKPLKVLIQSIGSEVKYSLETRNVSNSGLFLSFEQPGRFPFIPSSIMEVWLELEEGHSIFFNGKMSRVVHPSDSAAKLMGPGIAIRIIQIDAEADKSLNDYINKFAQQGEPETLQQAS